MTIAELVLSICIVMLVVANGCMYFAMREEEKKSKYFNETCCKLIIENTKLKQKLAEEVRKNEQR